ncbi:conserved hypothetical protein (fragment) [Ralstonia solanacearum K60]
MIAAYEAGNCRECVEFNAGGFWEGKVLINGLIQTWSDDPAAQRLMRRYTSAIKKLFDKKVNAYWIGPEAYEFLKPVFRLECISRVTLCLQIWLDDLVAQQRGAKPPLIAQPTSGLRCPRRVQLRRRNYLFPELEANCEFSFRTGFAIRISVVA